MIKKFKGGFEMANYVFKTTIDQNEYDAFVTSRKDCVLLQSYNWAKIKDNWGHIYCGAYEDGKLVASALVLKRYLPLKQNFLYIPRGPIMDYENESLVAFFFRELKKLAKKEHSLFIRFDPNVIINSFKMGERPNGHDPKAEIIIDILKRQGALHHGFNVAMHEATQPRFQAAVYFKDNWENELPKHTKRLVKDSVRYGVKISYGHLENLDDFCRLMAMTEDRKSVHLRGREYYEKLLNTYGDDAVIFLAKVDPKKEYERLHKDLETLEEDYAKVTEKAPKKKKQLSDRINGVKRDMKMYEEIGISKEGEIAIAGILSVKYGHILEMLYAGMDVRFKKFMPQYEEYIENFKWGLERSCTIANMGGVEGNLDDGLAKFKANFNPYFNEYLGQFDISVNKALYKMAMFGMKALKKA